MYSNSFGYGVYKKSQVNMGNPYQVRSALKEQALLEEEPVLENEIENAEKKAHKILDKAREEAQLIKREAEFEAERIMEEARNQAEGLIEQIEQSAKEEGYRYGEAVAQQHYNDLLAEAEEYKEKCKSEYEETIRSLEQDIVELALQIAKKVIGAELEASRDVIVKMAADTVNACINRDHIILKVSSEDYDYVIENTERIKSFVSDLGHLEIKKDQSLKAGSCLIDTGFGMVDGSLDTKMELVRNAFYEVLGEQK